MASVSCPSGNSDVTQSHGQSRGGRERCVDACVGCGQQPLLNLQGAVTTHAPPAALPDHGDHTVPVGVADALSAEQGWTGENILG